MRIVAMISVLILGACVGCGSNPKAGQQPTHPVTGKVLLNGTPLEGATVTFHPTGKSVGASGTTNATGEFRLTTYEQNDGAVAGTFKVTVKKMESEGKAKEIAPGVLDPNGAVTAAKSLVPAKYTTPEQTDLTANVTDAGPNQFTLELKK
ncbi:MAG: carboxypeptidase-like regulatory domain-containing protein [Gemmataceae bacterium]